MVETQSDLLSTSAPKGTKKKRKKEMAPGLKLKLQRVAKKLDMLASKERNINTPVGWEERWFTWRVFKFRYGRIVKPCQLHRLPVELLLQILEYLQRADPVQLSDHRYPLLSLRL